MHTETRLKLSAVFFAVFWTAAMVWWNVPDTAGLVILVITGGIAGLLWYWLYGKWYRRYFAQR
jgi:hypothetical protein